MNQVFPSELTVGRIADSGELPKIVEAIMIPFPWLLLCTLLAHEVPAADPPAKRLELAHWKLTLPFDTDRPGRPDEIQPAELRSFSDPRCFFFDREAGGVVFRAHCGGATTKNSRYPRCELREMTDSGKTEAAWATDDGLTHSLRLRTAITKTPPVKQHVVCAQIHDGGDDLLMIRLEGMKLFIERNDLDDVELDRAYQLGTPFELTLQAAAGRVKVWYDGALRLDWPVLFHTHLAARSSFEGRRNGPASGLRRVRDQRRQRRLP